MCVLFIFVFYFFVLCSGEHVTCFPTRLLHQFHELKGTIVDSVALLHENCMRSRHATQNLGAAQYLGLFQTVSQTISADEEETYFAIWLNRLTFFRKEN
jgi:hypothetical protein